MNLSTRINRIDSLLRGRFTNTQANTQLFKGDAESYFAARLGKSLTPKQSEILQKLDTPPYRVLVRSANTQGKTFVAAGKCSHFFDSADPSITLATAPTQVQVRDLLFKELRSLRNNPRGFLPRDTRLESSWNHYVHGFTAATPDAFQGRHAERLGIVFDEATGVHRDFWSRAETMFESHGGHWWLACYNPNDSSSPAYLAEESGGWHLVVLSALEHPNILAELAGEPPPFPAAIRLDTVLRRIASDCTQIVHAAGFDPHVDFEFPVGSGILWHPNTPEFEAQVLGRWPVSPAMALWSPVMFDLCCRGDGTYDPRQQIAVGCDVARFGDDKTVIFARIGAVAVMCEEYAGVDTTFIANRLREVCETLAAMVRSTTPRQKHYPTWREAYNAIGMHEDARTLAKQIPCYIDDTGGYGAGVVDQSDGYAFIGVNVSESASDPRFPNLRSQLWCQFADAARHGGVDFSRLESHARHGLRSDLTAVRYSLDSYNRRKVEPKVHIKERLGRSPDRADAAILCYSGIRA